MDGDLAEPLARQARCELLGELSRLSELQREARSLDADLQKGRWQLDRISYLFHSREVQRWLSSEPETSAGRQDAFALAGAVEFLWEQWRDLRRWQGSARGRRSVWVNARPVLLVWDSDPEKLEGIAAGPQFLESRWEPAWRNLGVNVALVDSDSHPVLPSALPSGQTPAVRASSDSGLPWTVRVASADPAADLAVDLESAIRRETVQGDLKGAAEAYKKIASQSASSKSRSRGWKTKSGNWTARQV